MGGKFSHCAYHTHNSVYCVFAILTSDVTSRCGHEICDRGRTHWIPIQGTLSRRLKSMNFEWDTLNVSVEFLETHFSPQFSPVWYHELFDLRHSFFTMAPQPPVGHGLLNIEASWSHSDTPHSVGFLMTSDQPDAETSTWQHTTLTGDRHPCPRRDSNHNPSKASSRRPTPYTARPLGSASYVIRIVK